MLGDGGGDGGGDGQADGVPDLRDLVEDAARERLLLAWVGVGDDEVGDCEEHCGCQVSICLEKMISWFGEKGNMKRGGGSIYRQGGLGTAAWPRMLLASRIRRCGLSP